MFKIPVECIFEICIRRISFKWLSRKGLDSARLKNCKCWVVLWDLHGDSREKMVEVDLKDKDEGIKGNMALVVSDEGPEEHYLLRSDEDEEDYSQIF